MKAERETTRSMACLVGMVALAGMLVLSLAACGQPGEPMPGSVEPVSDPASDSPFVVVLGIGQDAGVPQTGSYRHPGWQDAAQRQRVVSLGLVDPATGERWLFEATPDLPDQLYHLDSLAHAVGPDAATPLARSGLSGVFVTHAHIGHYTGLMYLGHEAMGAQAMPVYAMPRMAAFLTENGPWSQLVRYDNIALQVLADGESVRLNERLAVTPFVVPHRQEFSEVVGYRIEGPSRSVLFIPDIDSWEDWDEASGGGPRIEAEMARVDVAYLDATFYANGEIPGRDMSGFPHPFIVHSMDRFAPLPDAERAKVRFIHLNHTNPALRPDSAARDTIVARGLRVAETGEVVGL